MGSHLLRRLATSGAEVAALVRAEANLQRLGGHASGVRLMRGDLQKPCSFSRELNAFKPDYVFHLAAYGASYSQREMGPAVNINVLGMVNLLRALKKTTCQKIINIGSGLEYGSVEGEITEGLPPSPVCIYGSTKAAATLVAHQLARQYGMGIVTLRPFAVFGEGEDRTKFFCHVILSLLEGKDVALTGCEQYRDFCYVENIIDGIIAAAENELLQNEILNIASGRSHPLKHYVELIFKHCPGSSRPLYGAIPYRPDEIWQQRPSIDKIKSLLAWEPRVSLEEGINKTVNWYRERGPRDPF